MDLGIKNRIALVAASSQGLGRAVAFSLANEGVHLAICARDQKSITTTAEEIRTKTGVTVLPIVADVSSSSDIDTLVDETVKEFGKIDILVNNAGGPPTGTLSALPDSEWERGFQLTMMSMVRLTKAVLPIMVKEQWGRVLSIVSIAAKEPINDLLVSSTLRPGILGISKVLANQYGQFNITVNTVCPGYILTQRQEELSQSRAAETKLSMEEYLADRARDIPIGRLGNPEELGDVITFLASMRASYINGANIVVDGGQVKGIY